MAAAGNPKEIKRMARYSGDSSQTLSSFLAHRLVGDRNRVRLAPKIMVALSSTLAIYAA